MNHLAAHITAFIDHLCSLWQGGGGIRRRRLGAYRQSAQASAVQIGFTKPTRRKLNWTSRACFDVNDNVALGGRMRLASFK